MKSHKIKYEKKKKSRHSFRKKVQNLNCHFSKDYIQKTNKPENFFNLISRMPYKNPGVIPLHTGKMAKITLTTVALALGTMVYKIPLWSLSDPDLLQGKKSVGQKYVSTQSLPASCFQTLH